MENFLFCGVQTPKCTITILKFSKYFLLTINCNRFCKTAIYWRFERVLSKPLLYNHFGYKQSLAFHIVHSDIPPTGKKIKFSINNFFSKYDQIHSILRIQSHILNKFFEEDHTSRDRHNTYRSNHQVQSYYNN